MNGIRHIRRLAGVLASLAVGLVALGATPAFAMVIPPSGGPIVTGGRAPAPPVPPATTVTRTVLAGGMPGWQIALIAVAAALLAAAVAMLADRAWTTRGRPVRTDP
jgi:hypothetical protein